LGRLLPASDVAVIDTLRPGQLAALRFASDEETPGLVSRIVSGELKTSDEIKKAITSWRADHLRV
jgi:hypothetical protein